MIWIDNSCFLYSFDLIQLQYRPPRTALIFQVDSIEVVFRMNDKENSNELSISNVWICVFNNNKKLVCFVWFTLTIKISNGSENQPSISIWHICCCQDRWRNNWVKRRQWSVRKLNQHRALIVRCPSSTPFCTNFSIVHLRNVNFNVTND